MPLDFPTSPVDGQSFGSFTYDSSLPGWRSTPEVASGLSAGTIVQWPGVTAPANWLICDGSAVSRSTYASLFAVVGTTYGAGDGSTTFNLPNLKGRVAVGRDSAQTEFDTLGETGGAKTHILTTSEMPSHTHSISVGTSADWNDFFAGSTNTYGINPSYSGSAYSSPLSTVGGDGAHNNLQPYIVLNYIIKTSAGVTAGDSELAARVGATEGRATALETRATNLEAKSFNYLLNGAFDIWQRGDTVSQSSKPGADQWYFYYYLGMSQLRVTTGLPANSVNAMRVRSDVNGNLAVGVMQALETRTCANLWGKTVTFSVKVRRASTMVRDLSLNVLKSAAVDQSPASGTWTSVGSATVANASIPTGTTSADWLTASVTVNIPSDGTANTLWFEVRATGGMENGVYYEIAEAQVEIGSTRTPFRRNSPNPQAELVACQRYYWRFTQVDNYYMFNSATCWSSGGEMIVNVPLPTTQRVTGTQAMTNISSIYWLGNGTNITGATSPSYRPTREAFVLVCTVSGQTATNTWAFRPLVNSYLESSAEL